MRWPIRYQILLPYTAVVLFALAVSTLLNAYFARQQIDGQIQRQLRQIADTLSASNFPLTDAVLLQMKGLSGAEFVLSDSDGRTVAASRRWVSPLPLDRLPEQAAGELGFGPLVELDGSSYFQTVLRFQPRGGAPGPLWLRVLLPEDQWLALRRQAAFPSLVIGGISLALVGLCAVAISGRIGRPIQLLRSHLGILAEGKFHTLPLPKRNDELRDLYQSTNSLAEQLEKMRRAIVLSERLSVLGRLSAALAHQLRNHATGARMALQLHQRKCDGADAESVEVALRQLALSEEILKSFLTAARPPSPQKTVCRLGDLIDEVETLFGPTFRHRKVHLSVERPAEIEIHVDAGQIRQVLTNLVINALDAVGEQGWVRLECHSCDDGTTSIRVVDSGLGCPAEFQPHLFEPFASTKPEGVGLGLAVASQIAAAHGGTLTYSRRENCTQFELLIPIGHAAPAVTERVTQDLLSSGRSTPWQTS